MPPHTSSLTPPPSIHYDAPEPEVFQAAIETVRQLPGWEVISAYPDRGEIHARARGRLFSPSLEHLVRLTPADDGTEIDVESVTARDKRPYEDESSHALFRELLIDRLARRTR